MLSMQVNKRRNSASKLQFNIIQELDSRWILLILVEETTIVTTLPKEEEQQDDRFSFAEIYTYIHDGRCPSSFTKAKKQALRKRAKFFIKDTLTRMRVFKRF